MSIYGYVHRDRVDQIDIDEIVSNLKIYHNPVISMYMGVDESPYVLCIAANKQISEREADDVIEYLIKTDLIYDMSLMNIIY